MPGGVELEWSVKGEEVTIVGYKQLFDDEYDEEELLADEEEEKRAEAEMEWEANENDDADVDEEEIEEPPKLVNASKNENKQEQKKALTKAKRSETGKQEATKQDEKKIVSKKDATNEAVKSEVASKLQNEVASKLQNEVAPQKKGGKANKSVTLPSGLMYADIVVGTGPVATAGRVSVYYTGKLQSGKVFDSNTTGKGFAFQLGRGEVIKGWDEGVKGMRVGGTRRLVIPSKLGYGAQGTDGIPGNSILLFEVELIKA